MDLEDGCFAVKAARKAIEAEVLGASPELLFPPIFDRESGVFVTINTYPEGDLRGCIGYPDAVFPLKDALVYSAQSACHDPRFLPLTKREAEECTVEVTILTPPAPMDKAGLPQNIEIGRHGLVIQFGRRRGVLLPQVPVEWGWGPEEFLEQLCLKAGLPTDAWKLKEAAIFSFEGEIFHETEPNGIIVRG
ncbi:MAG: TIGR00296 family protein [Candidatus Methanomethylophilaceae archaeon]|nr:TIGR00296 family protein [Candidatus Methanomethylophilaceae archaeon]